MFQHFQDLSQVGYGWARSKSGYTKSMVPKIQLRLLSHINTFITFWMELLAVDQVCYFPILHGLKPQVLGLLSHSEQTLLTISRVGFS